LVEHKKFYWCSHCNRGLFFPPDCEHYIPDF
jgi:hypothetical protein